MVKNKTSFILYPYQSSTPYSNRIYSIISLNSRRSRRKVNFPKVNSIKRSHGYKSYNFCQVNFLSPPKTLNYNVLKQVLNPNCLRYAHYWIQSPWIRGPVVHGSTIICPRFDNFNFGLVCSNCYRGIEGRWHKYTCKF